MKPGCNFHRNKLPECRAMKLMVGALTGFWFLDGLYLRVDVFVAKFHSFAAQCFMEGEKEHSEK